MLIAPRVCLWQLMAAYGPSCLAMPADTSLWLLLAAYAGIWLRACADVTCGCLWLLLAACACICSLTIWLLTAELWLLMVAYGHIMAACACISLRIATCGGP